MSSASTRSSVQQSPSKDPPFSPALFIFTILASLAVLIGALILIAPGVWQAQLSASFLSFAAVFALTHAFGGLMEYFFHRYVLHAPLFDVLSYFYKQHTLHHALTRIVYRPSSTLHETMPTLVEVENRYPIVEEKQHEASFFPWYTLIVFGLLLTPLLALGQFLFPTAPFLLAGWTGLAFSMALYELVHAVEHWPEGRWHAMIARPNTGRFWRKAYAFHLRHHADIRCNEGISGVFGLPIYDFLFGTYVDPETLYLHGKETCPKQFVSPRPSFFLIRWLDTQAEKAVKTRREKRARA
jgi:hemolysin III